MTSRFHRLWSEIVRFTPVALFLVVITFVASQAYLSEWYVSVSHDQVSPKEISKEMGANVLNTTALEQANASSNVGQSTEQKTNTLPTSPVSHEQEDTQIGADQALHIALSFINVSVEDAERTKVTFDSASNAYVVKVTTAKMYATIVVDASKGTVLSLNKELE